MTTHTEKAPRQPAPPEHHEEFSGVFGFFRKYQKPILYTAGFFALITFSITGALLGFFRGIFEKHVDMPTLQVLGRTVQMNQDDTDIGRGIAHGNYSFVLPHIGTSEAQSELSEALAILRRVAITEGMEVSDLEVDRAVNFACSALKSMFALRGNKDVEVTPAMLAANSRAGSMTAFRMLVREAMRMGNYVRLQGLVADGSDQAALQELLRGKKKLTLRVASMDGKAIQAQIEKDERPTDEQLREFLDKMSEQDRNINQLYDTNRVSLQVGALALGQFDAAQWSKELAGFTPSEPELLRLYDEDKDPRFKVDEAAFAQKGIFGPPPVYWPFEAEDVQQALKQTARAEEAMNKLLTALRDQRAQALKEPNEALRKANEEHGLAVHKRDEAKTRLAASPDDQALKDALAAAEADVTAKKTVLDAADAALKAARLAWDFAAAFNAATAGRAGVRVVSVPGPKNAEELKQLPDDLGTWNNPFIALGVPNAGDLGASVAHTDKSIMLFKVTELVLRPLKTFDKAKDKLLEVWFTTKSKERLEEKKKALDAALLKLGKEKAGDKVAAIEGKRQSRIDEAIQTWKTKLEADIDKARLVLKDARQDSRATKEYRDLLAAWEKELADPEKKRKEIAEQTGKLVDDEIRKEASKFFAEVAEPACTEAGFAVATIGPLRRDLETVPHWDDRYGEPAKFLWTNGKVKQLDQGEATDILDDATNRKVYFVVCDRVEDLAVTDVSRKEWETTRRVLDTLQGVGMSFRETRVADTIAQSFGLDALKDRYQYATHQTEPVASADGKTDKK